MGLSEIWSGVFIPDPDTDFYPSRIPDPGVKKAPEPGSRGQKGTGSRIRKTLSSPKLDHLEVLSVSLLCLSVLEEVLAAGERWRLPEGEHLPERDAEGPDVAGVGVLALGEALQGQPLHRDVRRRLHHVVVVCRVPGQAKVRYFHCFLWRKDIK